MKDKPVFPSRNLALNEKTVHGRKTWEHPIGMTLREHYAGQFAEFKPYKYDKNLSIELNEKRRVQKIHAEARLAIQRADILLTELQKEPGE